MNIQNLSYETYCKGKMQYTYGNIAICCDFRPSKSLFVVMDGLKFHVSRFLWLKPFQWLAPFLKSASDE